MLWSTVASAFKISLRYLDPLQLLFYSSLTSILVLGAILGVQGKLASLASLSRCSVLRAALLGMLNPFLYYVILFAAYDRLPAQEAQPLNYTWAVTLSLLAVPLLGQKLRSLELLAIAVSYCGVVIISTRGDMLGLRFTDSQGVALALLSTIVWALYWIYNANDEQDPVCSLLLNFCFGFAAIAVCTGVFSHYAVADWRGLAGAAYVGVFEMGVAFVFWLMAMKLTTSSARVANLIFLSPFLSLVFIHFLVGEDIHGSTVAGLLCIIMGNVLQQMATRRPA